MQLYIRVFDFILDFEDETQKFGLQIKWLPMEQAEVKQESGK